MTKNPTIYNIIRWFAGTNSLLTKHLMFQVLFFFFTISCNLFSYLKELTVLTYILCAYTSNLHNWPWKYGLIFSRRFSLMQVGKWLQARNWLTFVVVCNSNFQDMPTVRTVHAQYCTKVLNKRQNKWPQNLTRPTGNGIRLY